MANQSKRIANLNVTTSISQSDRIVGLKNPATTANVVTFTISTLFSNAAITNSTPANSSSNGYTGNIAYDSNYVYICVANNTWKRAALSTW